MGGGRIFLPIWYPDGSYTPYTWLIDCWTPAGMLSMNLTDSVRVRRNLWQDWHRQHRGGGGGEEEHFKWNNMLGNDN